MKHTENLKLKSIIRLKGSQFSGSLKNKLFTMVFIGLLLLVCAGFTTKEIYQELCHSDFFQITAMEITGNRMASKEQITVLSKVDIYSNLLTINSAQVIITGKPSMDCLGGCHSRLAQPIVDPYKRKNPGGFTEKEFRPVFPG